jgi:long-chain-fatty-acid--CoA ligase ACSBG
LLAYKLSEHTVINIIGFNSPEWFFAFYGSLMARCVPVGIYTTNNQQTCEFIVEHSCAKVVLAENREYAAKYLNLVDQGVIRLLIVYNDPEYQPEGYEDKVVSYRRFIKEGARIENHSVEQRIEKIKPGHCCTLVYTSGTTGMPKGVMLSHDNYTWTKKSLDEFHDRDKNQVHRAVSYLPLSHVAAQFSDIVGAMMEGVHTFFADPSALQGSLIQTLQEVRPTFFFSVPRVWEKIYDRMMEISRGNGWLKTKIGM